MSTVRILSISYEILSCASCGTQIIISEDWVSRLRKNGELFYCHAGHSQWFGKSREDKLREELRDANNKITELEKLKKKRKYTKHKKEVKV